MLYILPGNAICHPEILLYWRVWMRQSRKKDVRQGKMFFGPDLSNGPASLEVPTHRQAELEKTLAELLLKTALGNKEGMTGADDDHDI
jgi:hypothetical protein